MEELLIRYMHFLGIMILSATLFAEHLLISDEMEIKQFKKFLIIDAIYGASAVIVFVAGLLLWLFVGKPSEFYASNPVFHIKLTLFVTIALLSIVPTVFALRNRKFEGAIIKVPKHVINIIRVELLLLLCIPFLAVLMAKGYGHI